MSGWPVIHTAGSSGPLWAQICSTGSNPHVLVTVLLTVKVPQREAHVCLGESQGDALVFELFGELLELLGGQVLLKPQQGRKRMTFLNNDVAVVILS